MSRISTNAIINAVRLAEQGSAPALPAPGYLLFYYEGGALKGRKSDGTIITLATGGGVAADTIWDAAGDLAVGSGADAAVRLARGSALQVLRVNAAGANLEWATLALASAAHQRTAGDLTTTSTTFVDVLAAFSFTITTGARRVIGGLVGAGATTVANGGLYFDVAVDGTRIGNVSNGLLARETPANVAGNVSFPFMTDVLTAGSHTIALMWRVSSGTGTLFASATATRFWVAEIYAA